MATFVQLASRFWLKHPDIQQQHFEDGSLARGCDYFHISLSVSYHSTEGVKELERTAPLCPLRQYG